MKRPTKRKKLKLWIVVAARHQVALRWYRMQEKKPPRVVMASLAERRGVDVLRGLDVDAKAGDRVVVVGDENAGYRGSLGDLREVLRDLRWDENRTEYVAA